MLAWSTYVLRGIGFNRLWDASHGLLAYACLYSISMDAHSNGMIPGSGLRPPLPPPPAPLFGTRA